MLKLIFLFKLTGKPIHVLIFMYKHVIVEPMKKTYMDIQYLYIFLINI